MSSGRFFSGAIASLSLMMGCGSSGPDLAYVSGVVKLDGQPLKEASVTFVPEVGRPSYGGTDKNGYYELAYTNDKAGALPGTHTIRVSTQRGADPDSGTKAQPERVPRKFNVQSQLKKTVVAGSNTVDVELTSKQRAAAVGGAAFDIPGRSR